MNKWVKKLIIPLILLLLLPILPMQALADGESVTVQIPFTVENAPGTVVMEALNEAPAPGQSMFVDVYEGTFQLTFTTAGDYLYKITQSRGSLTNYDYDESVYYVGVSVVYGQDGELICSTGISKGEITADESAKVKDIVFTNVPLYAYLVIDKVAKKGNDEISAVSPGDVFYYEITVTNNGRTAATNVEVVDALPIEIPLLEIVDTMEGELSESDGRRYITWRPGTIHSGETVSFRFSVRIPEIWGEVSWLNTTAAFYEGGDPERYGPDDLDGTDVFDGWFGTGGMGGYFNANTTATATSKATATVSAPPPNVIIEKEQSLNGGPRTKELIDVEPGDTVAYYLTVTNNSLGTAEDVIITDDIPTPPLMLLREGTISQGGQSDGGTITWNLGELEPGASVTLEFEVTVPDVSEYTHWVNQASGSYSDKGEVTVYSLLSNPVEAKYGTPPTPTPDEPEDPTSGPENPEDPTSESENPEDPTPNPGNPDDPTPDPGEPDSPGEGPQTGDNSNIGLWITIMIGAFIGLVVLFFAGRKKRDKRV